MSLPAAGAVLAAATLDRLLAEPPERLHPVAVLGSVVALVDRRYPESRAAGVAAAALLPLVFAGLAAGSVRIAGDATAMIAGSLDLPADAALLVAIAVAAGVAAVVVFACSSLRMLVDVAGDVVALTGTDLPRAREELIALAGRDAASLSAAEVRSAAVESAAENLADGHTAPVLGFVVGVVGASLVGSSSVGALAAGAGVAAWVKGVNTLDSMLGYRGKPIGWAPARLDDAVMWLPARAAVVLIAVAAGSPGLLARAREWARVPASPNAGWPMAALAAALDVRLAKRGAYSLNTDAEFPDARAAERGIATVRRAGWLGVGSAVAVLLASGAVASV